MQTKRIKSLALDSLIGHSDNPNRMSLANQKKLADHIERTGNYEPIIVRVHPGRAGCWQIINGHHRVKALKKLRRRKADCVIWQVDDDETMLLLATLNRLGGDDDLEKKSKLIKKLSERFDTKSLASKLADNKKVIERLKEFNKVPQMTEQKAKAFLNPVVFFLTDEQMRIVEEAITSAIGADSKGTAVQKRAEAFVKIVRAFISKTGG